MPQPATERLILVSNRLPVVIERDEQGALQTRAASGGLATGLRRPHEQSGGRWIGWPGITSEDGALPDDVIAALDELAMTGVGLTPDEHERYYTRVSNRCIWPLFHYFKEKVRFDPVDWETYEAVNRKVADAVLAEARPGDLVFVQDFHLMLVPAMLRAAGTDLRIGFFLHIPFPAAEIFRIFPPRAQVLRGLLGADVIAFHTLEYTRHFRASVRRVLGVETRGRDMRWEGRLVQVLAQPLGLETDAWQRSGDDPDIAAATEELRGAIAGRRLILGVERLDYTKGVPERLRAFRDLLAEDPSLVDQVVMVQIAVPSRVDAQDYRDLKDEVERLVGEINGRFGRPGCQPLHYMFRGVPQATLIAMYRMADVAFVTPLRDGLNLVAKEYVAARTSDTGVLVIGEFAGAAWELGEALQVNPFDPAAMKAVLARALTMQADEQARRMAPLRARVVENDVHRWTDACLDAIRSARRTSEPTLLCDSSPWTQRWADARERVLLLDYDGTLREFEERPEDALPSAELRELLTDLARDHACDTWIVSGRPTEFLERWFGPTGVGLIAEHGAFLRAPGAREFETLVVAPPGVWRDEVLDVMRQVQGRVPASRIEEKPLGLAWHYRAADPVMSSWQARELYQHLSEVLSGRGLEVLSGNRVIEVRPAGVSKARAAATVLARRATQPDFLAAFGDDVTDESLFRELPKEALTVLVGHRDTAARARIEDPAAVRSLLATWLAKGAPRVS